MPSAIPDSNLRLRERAIAIQFLSLWSISLAASRPKDEDGREKVGDGRGGKCDLPWLVIFFFFS